MYGMTEREALCDTLRAWKHFKFDKDNDKQRKQKYHKEKKKKNYKKTNLSRRLPIQNKET